MIKIGSLVSRAMTIILYYDDKAKSNPYRIYKKYWDNGWHKKLIEKYENLASCTWWIAHFIQDHDQDRI